ncbi:MAG: serine/threonine-protein phosphatase [Clostridia bacterium]|nr:serine/threonine-protein phosphatase [Clostridia bacterium]
MIGYNRKAIRVGKLEGCGSSLPAGKVGGDFFEFFVHNNKNVVAAIGDVMGKGFPAACLMKTIHTMLCECVNITPHPLEVVRRLNKIGGDELRRRGAFVTLCIIYCDGETGRLSCVNAGHHPPIIVSNGEVKVVRCRGVALGLLEDYLGTGEEEIYLSPGDMVVMYTDGLVEAFGPGEKRYGLERLKKIVHQQPDADAAKMKRCILSDLKNFTRGYSQRDDITLLVLRVLKKAGEGCGD